MPVEKLTRERRRQQTREVLIAAAAEVFARRGFEGASLEEIAATAGFTRGAVYKNFAGKEELFLAVMDEGNEQIINRFRDIAPTQEAREWDFATLTEMWKASVSGVDVPIGLEFQLYLLRNPSARKRAAAHHRKNQALVAAFIDEVAARSDRTLRFPSSTLAAIVLAAADGLTYAARIDGEDLFGPFLELLNAGMFAD